MLFNSFDYLIFIPVVLVLFYLLPHKTRWFLLLVASYYFYGSWRVEYLLLILFSTLVSYFAAILIGRRSHSKTCLWIGVIANLLPLLIFKYYDFAAESLNELARLIHWNYSVATLHLLLPVGISFYTFQAIGYLVDVYRGKTQPETHLGLFALFVSFFPQLVAGPIERSGHLLPQFKKKIRFLHENFRDGLTLIGWGLFKKVVIADRVAQGVNAVYGSPETHGGLAFILATTLFAFQIYGDFSGYSDIARGSAKLFGYDIMRNFNRPYFSKSVAEFWRRWHISLTTWFRDYVYIPLGGNRVVKWRWYYNLAITFLLSGLWHGAAWTFVIWAALHAMYMLVGSIKAPFSNRLLGALSIGREGYLYRVGSGLITFILVCFGWIFFRADSLTDAGYIVSNLFTNLGADLRSISSVDSLALLVDMSALNFLVAVGSILVMIVSHFLSRGETEPLSKVSGLPTYARWPIYYALTLVLIFFGVFTSEEFIYFQF